MISPVASLAQAAPRSRLYSVQPSRPTDHPLLAQGVASADYSITISRLDGARLILSALHPWQNTDVWAAWRWRQAEAARKRMEGWP